MLTDPNSISPLTPSEASDRRAQVDVLNNRFKHHSATAVIAGAAEALGPGKLAMVSSFGAESVALLHLSAMVDRYLPVLFIDTRLLFAETLVYQQEIAERLNLQDLRVIQTDRSTLDARDPYGALRLSDTDACCALRKTEPLNAALSEFDGWITGRKRYQSRSRATLDHFEFDASTGRIKVNPLAYWGPGDVVAYMEENRLPKHPLVSQGYPSIGCAPCTSKVADGEDPRAGRWRNDEKEECGIHFVDGRPVRQSA